MNVFAGKLAVQQRVLPLYRAPFFQHLAQKCSGGLTLLAGQPLPIEAIRSAERIDYAQIHWIQNQHVFHPRHPLFLCRQSGIIEWLESEDPDALVIEANPRYPNTRQAISWMQNRNKPVLGWGLGAPPISGPLANLRTTTRIKFIESLNGIIAYSKLGADQYRALDVLPKNRIFVAQNAAAPPPEHEAPARGPLNAPLHIIFVGRLQARKRVDLLLNACAQLPETLQPALTIVGDGPERTSFEAIAQQVYPRTVFTGQRHGPELASVFAEADLFVLPGSGGLAIQEAMSYALPVIVAEGDGSQDDLVREDNGWLVIPGDLQSLKNTLQKALTDPKLREKGAAGRRIVASEINLHKMADQFIFAVNTVATNL